jgi:transcriptional/translational regulatory protein YebC/TACO1
VRLTDAIAIASVQKLIDALEEHDDVKEVFSNAVFEERDTAG